MIRKINKILSSILILAMLVLPSLAFADSLIELQKRALELEIISEQHQNKIQKLGKEVQTLKRDINILNEEIAEAKLKIQQTSLAIQMTELAIGAKQKDIEQLETEIVKQKNVLAEYIRTVGYYDQESLLEILLSKEDLADVLNRVEALEVLQTELHKTLEIIRTNKKITLDDKVVLETQEEEQVSLRKLQESQKRSLQKKEQEKSNILAQTKGNEAKYQKLLSQNQIELRAVKDKIRLLQSKGEQSLTPERAIELAQEASRLTGVSPALILGVLEQESALGLNLGDCNYKIALRAGHDYEEKIFEDIVQELYPGKNPAELLVSCPLKNSKGEYVYSGGAMGPAQFMPKTWWNMKPELESLLGYTANPWMPEDAIIAMALYLKRNGALTSWRQAAGAYFGRCTLYSGGKLLIDYCNAVATKAKGWEEEIKRLG